MGKVQTSYRGSTKQAERWTWTGVCVGAGHTRDSDRARTTDFSKGGVAAQIRAQGTPEAYGKVGHAMMQEKSHLTR